MGTANEENRKKKEEQQARNIIAAQIGDIALKIKSGQYEVLMASVNRNLVQKREKLDIITHPIEGPEIYLFLQLRDMQWFIDNNPLAVQTGGKKK